jgi:hypothetical protein
MSVKYDRRKILLIAISVAILIGTFAVAASLYSNLWLRKRART